MSRDMGLGIKVKKLRMVEKIFINYTYVVFDEETKHGLIIDPAWELDKIVQCIEKENIIITGILLTHSHYDHINLVNELIEIYDCKIYMGKEEIEYYDYACKNLNAVVNKEVILSEVMCIHTPGHTKGSYCYLIKDKLFTGDTLFIEGCGICTEDGGDAQEMYESLQTLKRLIGNNVLVYPGHAFRDSPGEEFSKIKQKNIYLQIENKQTFINLKTKIGQRVMEFI